ncbi:hypothetical protein CGLO_04049 [Colletotrichum gloeosporioides Cg-14]|uniref:Uncharacterized protein n=1 Tax=Colletotrichum gloeosporioides (strain Cg-14) TaxID=1237896 RepID=T0M579_COLGC|nr:hypothetical protein CGLO_04049 [Colletotrichum gloeosporioides Cg-14]
MPEGERAPSCEARYGANVDLGAFTRLHYYPQLAGEWPEVDIAQPNDWQLPLATREDGGAQPVGEGAYRSLWIALALLLLWVLGGYGDGYGGRIPRYPGSKVPAIGRCHAGIQPARWAAGQQARQSAVSNASTAFCTNIVRYLINSTKVNF